MAALFAWHGGALAVALSRLQGNAFDKQSGAGGASCNVPARRWSQPAGAALLTSSREAGCRRPRAQMTHWFARACAAPHGRSACIGLPLPLEGLEGMSAQVVEHAETRDRTGDLQIFSLTLSQLSYRGCGCRRYCHTHRNVCIWLASRVSVVSSCPWFCKPSDFQGAIVCWDGVIR